MEECAETVEQCWWNSVIELWNSVGGIVEQSWLNCVVEQWNSDGGTVEPWNSGTVKVEQCGGTVE